MKTFHALDAVGYVDGELIEKADKASREKKRRAWVRWGALTACLCIAAAAAWITIPRFSGKDDTAGDSEDAICEEGESYSVILDGNGELVYAPISFSERLRYGLLPEDSIGLTPENTYQITEKDLGAPMGTITASGDNALIGSKAYHFASYPKLRSICILDCGGEYAFYCSNGYIHPIAVGESFDVLLGLYGIPGSCTAISVQTPDGTELYTVTEQARIGRLCELLSGCESIGHEASERRFAQAWYDATGNDDFYYSEESGNVVYRGSMPQPEKRTYIDNDGNTVTEAVYPDDHRDPFDEAHELWDEGERCLEIETSEGFRLFVDYFPSVGLFFSEDGQFALTDEAMEELDALLNEEG